MSEYASALAALSPDDPFSSTFAASYAGVVSFLAAAVADAALAAPRNGIVEIAGPERAPFDEIVARYPKAVGDTRPVVRDPAARYFGGLVKDDSLVPLGEARLGKRSFGAERLGENLRALLATLVRAKPAASKGQYLQSIAVSTTMGPAVRIDPLDVHAGGA